MKIVDKRDIKKEDKYMQIIALKNIGSGRHPFKEGTEYKVGIALGAELIKAKKAKAV